jgi:hypothetical protein
LAAKQQAEGVRMGIDIAKSKAQMKKPITKTNPIEVKNER